MADGKRIRAARGAVDREKHYGLAEALKLVKENAGVKFDETVELSMNLGVDPRHADQNVRGVVSLPNGSGKTVRIAVFAKGDKVAEARDAGADFVGGQDLVEKIQGGWMEFDRVIASPDMMGVVGKLGRVLGPRGLMPNPKLGTVTPDVARAVEEQRSGKVEYRVDKNGIVDCSGGKRSFDSVQLVGNGTALRDAILRAKPASTKGIYVKTVALSTTMGPGIKVDPGSAATRKAA